MSEHIDLHKVVLEIEDEVRSKRASGDLPPEVERELDLIFARFAPAGALEGDFEQLMERAEQQAFFDLLAPNDSNRPGVPHIKRVVQKTVRWYLRYVIDQITGFSHTITKAVRQLGQRVQRIESLAADDEELITYWAHNPCVMDATMQTQIVTMLKGVRGRVLCARCGRGEIVDALAAAGIDAYGIDVVGELVTQATSCSAIDLRVASELAHLEALPASTLNGVVLWGGIDVIARGDQIRVLDACNLALSRGGTLIIIGTDPSAFSDVYGPVVADLAAGSPLCRATWQHLLGSRGFAVDVRDVAQQSSQQYLIVATKP